MARTKNNRSRSSYKMKGFPKHATTSPLTSDDEVDYSKFSANMELTEDQKLKSRELAGHKKVGDYWTRPMTEEEREKFDRSLVTAGSGPGVIDIAKKTIQGGKWLYGKLTN